MDELSMRHRYQFGHGMLFQWIYDCVRLVEKATLWVHSQVRRDSHDLTCYLLESPLDSITTRLTWHCKGMRWLQTRHLVEQFLAAMNC